MQQLHKEPLLYAMLGLIVVLLLVSIAIQLSMNRDDNITSWATIRAQELHMFFGDCKSGGGSIDVRPNSAPNIIFMCNYVDKTVEYTLGRGK